VTQEISDKGTNGLSGVVGVGVVKRRRRLSAEDKYQIFVEASRGDVPVRGCYGNGASSPRTWPGSGAW